MTVPNRPTAGGVVESAWGGVVHDTAVAMDIQSGSTEVALPSGSGDGANPITFPRPFAGVPVVVVGSAGTVNGGSAGSNQYAAAALSVTATGFSARVSHAVGTTSPQSCSVRWIAYGPRA